MLVSIVVSIFVVSGRCLNAYVMVANTLIRSVYSFSVADARAVLSSVIALCRYVDRRARSVAPV